MRTWSKSRRLRWGAVLACGAWWAAACGSKDDLSAPETPPSEPPPDQGQAPTPGCTEGTLQHGALYRICFPPTWNGDLVLYAHGYVARDRALAILDDAIGGQPASAVVTELGYAFATTSYRANGLVAPDAVDDLVELADTIDHRYKPDPARTAIVGFSEGGLVATLAVERHPDRFDGALAACGPIGNFRSQLDYIADFRVVFDYLFSGALPGTAVDVPQFLRDRWSTVYTSAVVVSLATNPAAARELIAITKAPVAGDDIQSITATTLGLLWYNVFGTADARERLGGQPFDNMARVYSGSSDDDALNAGVARFSADPAALAALQNFETTGNLEVPMVTLHTSRDPIVPVNQSSLYGTKVNAVGAGSRLTQSTVDRFGHCTFEAPEVLGGFTKLWEKIANSPAAVATSAGGN
jgi:pimeloyl-ACP methyl ester carboxylesterase